MFHNKERYSGEVYLELTFFSNVSLYIVMSVGILNTW